MTRLKNPEFDKGYRDKISAYAAGEWFMLPRAFLFAFTRDEAIALASLIDAADRFLSIERYNGWFYYTREKMQLETVMDKNVQDRVIKSLMDKGYIRKKRMGIPPRRFFFIEIDRINDSISTVRQIMREKKIVYLAKKRKKKIKKAVDKFIDRSMDG
jgi:hypothetical protein